MDKYAKWIAPRIRIGWVILAVGTAVCLSGILLELGNTNLSFNPAIITGLGILWVGIGVGIVVRYRAALVDEQAARRLTAAEMDERTVFIRARAGSRAYWVSMGLVYTGLMWVSFAANGDLPELSGDTLWYFLAACVIAPFGVYVLSMMVDQRKL